MLPKGTTHANAQGRQIVRKRRPCSLAQLQAYFPDALLVERKGYLEALWDQTGHKGTAVVEYGFSKEFMRPRATHSSECHRWKQTVRESSQWYSAAGAPGEPIANR